MSIQIKYVKESPIEEILVPCLMWDSRGDRIRFAHFTEDQCEVVTKDGSNVAGILLHRDDARNLAAALLEAFPE